MKKRMGLDDHLELADCFALALGSLERAAERLRFCGRLDAPALKRVQAAVANIDAARAFLDGAWVQDVPAEKRDKLGYIYYLLRKRADELCTIPLCEWGEAPPGGLYRQSDDEVFSRFMGEALERRRGASMTADQVLSVFRCWWLTRFPWRPWPTSKVEDFARRFMGGIRAGEFKAWRVRPGWLEGVPGNPAEVPQRKTGA